MVNREKTYMELQDDLIKRYGNFLVFLGIDRERVRHAQGALKHDITRVVERAIKNSKEV